ncbi:MAG: hypothetical protein RMK20_01265 [Verrucomicrobiales bacterium]|nr:hypothetical protein [Verrucomicrobiales bacterium]
MSTEPPGETTAIWGPYPNYDDIARFEYGRRLWKHPDMRARLLAHWLDPRHPYRERFLQHRAAIEWLLESTASERELDDALRRQGSSLRCLAREIPPVFGSFFGESAPAAAGAGGSQTPDSPCDAPPASG